MIYIAAVGASLGSILLASVSGLPEWAATGVSSAFMTGLWYQERKDRRQAEDREREVLVRALGSVEQLSRATEVLDAFIRGGGGLRDGHN